MVKLIVTPMVRPPIGMRGPGMMGPMIGPGIRPPMMACGLRFRARKQDTEEEQVQGEEAQGEEGFFEENTESSQSTSTTSTITTLRDLGTNIALGVADAKISALWAAGLGKAISSSRPIVCMKDANNLVVISSGTNNSNFKFYKTRTKFSIFMKPPNFIF